MSNDGVKAGEEVILVPERVGVWPGFKHPRLVDAGISVYPRLSFLRENSGPPHPPSWLCHEGPSSLCSPPVGACLGWNISSPPSIVLEHPIEPD